MWLRFALAGAMACASSPAVRAAQPPPPPPVPALKGSPKASAQRELSASGLTLLPKRARDSKTFSSFVAKLGYRESTLYLSVEVSDPSVTSGDILKVSLFFPLSGTTA